LLARLDLFQLIIFGVLIFISLLISRIVRYPVITRDRMIAIVLFAVFTIIFWASFEQAGGSMTLFAKDYTSRVLTGGAATAFNVADIIITVVPIAIITWVLYKLFRQTFSKYALSNIFLGTSFVIIWVIVGWKINRNLNSNAYEVSYSQIVTDKMDDKGKPVLDDDGKQVEEKTFITSATALNDDMKIVSDTVTIREPKTFEEGAAVLLIDVNKKGDLRYIRDDQLKKIKTGEQIKASVIRKKGKEVEIPASWFGILNSLFIIMFAPLFSKWWESKYNPSGASKYGIGLILLGIGFAALAFGAMSIPEGAKAGTITVSMVWLIVAYLFHTLGELCLSPVALSYISKLVPGRMIALMFGIWYVAVAIGNKTAGKMGGMIEQIQEEHSLTFFFMIFTLVPVGLGLLAIALNPLFKKLMHGVK
jgi:POT family proton-dependent oligopeptide transporter